MVTHRCFYYPLSLKEIIRLCFVTNGFISASTVYTIIIHRGPPYVHIYSKLNLLTLLFLPSSLSSLLTGSQLSLESTDLPCRGKGRIDAPYHSFNSLSQHYLSIPMPWAGTCSYSQTTPPVFFYWRHGSLWSGRCSHLLTQVEWPAPSGASFLSSFHIEWLQA